MGKPAKQLTQKMLLDTVRLLEELGITVRQTTVMTALRVQHRAFWPSYDAVSLGLRKALADGLLEQNPRTKAYSLPLRRRT